MSPKGLTVYLWKFMRSQLCSHSGLLQGAPTSSSKLAGVQGVGGWPTTGLTTLLPEPGLKSQQLLRLRLED